MFNFGAIFRDVTDTCSMLVSRRMWDLLSRMGCAVIIVFLDMNVAGKGGDFLVG